MRSGARYRLAFAVLTMIVLAGCDFSGLNENDGGMWVPSDATSAIGPTRFIELVNSAYAIYDRNADVLASGASANLYGTGSAFISDPQVVWDVPSQRFFFAAIANKGSAQSPDWGLVYGFSKGTTPSSTADFCKYFLDANYKTTLPDFPRLGLTQDFALIGVNRFTATTAVNARVRARGSQPGAAVASSFLGTDVSWITKPPSGTITTCPLLGTNGIFRGLTTAAGNPAATAVPAREVDAMATGWIVATGDPLPATTIDVYSVTKQGGSAALSNATAITVPSYDDAPNPAPQAGGNPLDVGDSRFSSAWYAPDPRLGHNALWTAHTIAGGAGAQVRWYELNPATATIDQSGTVSDPNLYVYYPAIAPDRGAGSFGSDMAMTLSTSSSTQPTAAAMVSKAGSSATSALVIQHQSTVAWNCTVQQSIGACRWGDYNGASPDPSPPSGRGQLWLTGEWNTSSLWQTWNWQVTP